MNTHRNSRMNSWNANATAKTRRREDRREEEEIQLIKQGLQAYDSLARVQAPDTGSKHLDKSHAPSTSLPSRLPSRLRVFAVAFVRIRSDSFAFPPVASA